MAKISRRDFLKLFLAAAGAFFAISLQKLSQQPAAPGLDVTATPFQPRIDFSHWGQDDLTFAALTVPYNDLR